MPEVYDPTHGSMFRSRRRRKRKVANPNVVVVGSTENNASDFGQSDFERNNANIASLASPASDDRIVGTRRKKKDCLLSKNTTNRKITSPTTKEKRDTVSKKSSKATPLSPQVTITRIATPTAIPKTSVTAGKEQRYSSTSADSFFQYAIALDTRYLNNQIGKDDQNYFQQRVKHFLQTTFRRRGLSPSVVTWTECCSDNDIALPNDDSSQGISSGASDYKPTNRHPTTTRKGIDLHTINRSGEKGSCSGSNITIRSKSLKDNDLDEILLNVIGSPIQSSTSNEKNKNQIAVHLPKGLMANSTWNIFDDLVEAIVDRFSPSSAPLAYRTPIRVVIFTSAASSLLDINSAGHVSGIDEFWNRTNDHFLNSKVQSIEIVVVMGETVVVRSTKDKCGIKRNYDRFSNHMYKEESDARELNKIEHERTTVVNSQRYDGYIYDANTDIMHSSLNDSFRKQADTIKTMDRYIKTKVDVDFRMNRIRIQLDSKFVEKQSRMKMSVVNSTIDFHSLCQKWSRDSILAATAVTGGQPFPMISFYLPETNNFDACGLSFSVYYKNVPFRLDSSQATQLFADLELLGRTKLDVLQLVPFLSIDASLIYGVTIGLRVAHEDDEERHYEKKLLAQSLFKNLATMDCALLLRSSYDPDIENENFHNKIRTTNANGGLFHSSEESQYFLFMPEFVVSQDGAASMKNGVLHRIASVDHILEETSAVDILNTSHPLYSEMGKRSRRRENPFSEYIEASLDCLNCSPLNPWVQHGLKNSISTWSSMDAKRQDSRKVDIFSRCVLKDRAVRDKNGQVLKSTTTASGKKSSHDNVNTDRFF